MHSKLAGTGAKLAECDSKLAEITLKSAPKYKYNHKPLCPLPRPAEPSITLPPASAVICGRILSAGKIPAVLVRFPGILSTAVTDAAVIRTKSAGMFGESRPFGRSRHIAKKQHAKNAHCFSWGLMGSQFSARDSHTFESYFRKTVGACNHSEIPNGCMGSILQSVDYLKKM